LAKRRRPRILALADLTPAQRDLVLAMLRAEKAADSRRIANKAAAA
jgi:hypothetical protein